MIHFNGGGIQHILTKQLVLILSESILQELAFPIPLSVIVPPKIEERFLPKHFKLVRKINTMIISLISLLDNVLAIILFIVSGSIPVMWSLLFDKAFCVKSGSDERSSSLICIWFISS